MTRIGRLFSSSRFRTGFAAAVADQHHVRAGLDVVGDGPEGVAGGHHLAPVVEVPEEEGHVHQRGLLGEGRHVRRRDDGVVDREPLAHVGEVVLLETELAVPVELELHRLAVILLHQLGELQHGLVEGVVVVELAGPAQRDRLGGGRRRGDAGHGRGEGGQQGQGEADGQCPHADLLLDGVALCVS
jgi:hypothetical protein